jgi:uncharacterized C2H2 Zn-finger protein
MFQCPKCGYRDDPCWRAACWLKVATYCRLDELRTWQPALAETLARLKTGEVHVEGAYSYRVTRSGNVYRLLKEYSSIYSSHGFTESAPDSKMKKSLRKKHFASYTKNP